MSSTQHNHNHQQVLSFKFWQNIKLNPSLEQPFKHMLAQKYAAESTSEGTGSSSENRSQLHHNMQQFYAYSPLVSSSCGTTQYENNLLDANNRHNDVIHVESTSGQIDSEDSQLMQSQVFHDSVIENLIKQEQTTAMNSTLVSSTSAANMARHEILFECNSEAVDSTTSSGHQITYTQSLHTYHEPIDKISMQSLVAMQTTESHHLLQPHYLHASTSNQLSVLQPQSIEQCLQPIQESIQQHSTNLLEPDLPQENVINDLPVLSRARASLPAEYLYIEEPDNSITVLGVFAKKTIPKRTQFGPVEGVIITHSHSTVQNLSHNLMIYITESLILDQSDENQSNWMKFVRSANTFEEQNLALVTKEQVSGNEIEIKFFFLTTRAIYAREELKVWYSREYAEKFNLKQLEPKIQPIFETDEHNSDISKRLSNSIDIVATGGHKLRTKIAKTQQQLQQQQQQKAETQENKSQNEVTDSSNQSKENRIQPKYQCETCQKAFPRFYSLRRHQIMHSGLSTN